MNEGGVRGPDGGAHDPDGEAEVRRLLAQAGGPVPTPDEVTARLDDVLSALQRERSTGSPAGAAASASAAGDAVELRARRRWPRLLLAAAAVVVGGYSVGTLVAQGTLSGSENASAGDAAAEDSSLAERESADSDRLGGLAESRPRAANEEEPATALDAGRGYTARLAVPPTLRSDRLATDVRRALRLLELEVAALEAGGGEKELRAQSGCTAPEVGPRERSLQVRYDGVVAVLVAEADRQRTVEATVYDCSGTVIDSTLVPR